MATVGQCAVSVRLDDAVPGKVIVDPAGALHVYLRIDEGYEQSIGVLARQNESEHTAWDFRSPEPKYAWISALAANMYASPESFLEAVRMYLYDGGME